MRHIAAIVMAFFLLCGCSGGDSPSSEPVPGMTFSTKAKQVADPSGVVNALGGALTNAGDGKPAALSVVQLPDLSFPSGQVVAGDGFILMDAAPFVRKVTPGRYPLLLAIARFDGDERIAFAMLRFSDAPVTKWEMATTAGQDPATLKKDEIFGYGVDSGTGCFCDPGARDAMEKVAGSGEKWSEQVIDAMQKSYKPTREWIHIETKGGSAALFSSGFGDGLYALYFGLDEAGNAVVLVTDFGIVNWPRRP